MTGVRIWAMGQEDFMGHEGRVVFLQADKVQACQSIPSTEHSLAKGGVSMGSNVAVAETHADVEPWQVRLGKQAEAIRD